VDNREVANLASEGEAAQPFFISCDQLLACPVDRHLGERVKIAGRLLERRLFVVVPFHDRAFQLLNDLDALVRVGVVTDDIAEAT